MKKELSLRRTKKEDREHRILLGLVELYIESGKPIGSNTLREEGFDDLSSATIRNYFVQLENEGYLHQQHTSGGRIPTGLAFQAYAESFRNQGSSSKEENQRIDAFNTETKEIAVYLHSVAEELSRLTGLAVFLTAPRFDHDFILDIKLVALDVSRVLCVMITDFGSILTEVIHSEKKLSSFALKRMEQFFTWKLTGQEPDQAMSDEEVEVAGHFYSELMVRFITRYSSFNEAEIYRTGFSNLLHFPEFKSATALANGLSLFENQLSMRRLLHDCERQNETCFWIGESLDPYVPSATHCAVVATPYRIHQSPVGALGVLGPLRIPYRRLFGLMARLSHSISETLTKSLYRYRIQYRKPTPGTLYLPQAEQRLLDQSSQILLGGEESIQKQG